MTRFTDRREAGRALAQKLLQYANRPDVVVLALPRGGVPVAYEVATALNASLDVLIVRKIGAPWNEELAVGAIASGDTMVLDAALMRDLGIDRADVDRVIAAERLELRRREQLYRDSRPFPVIKGKTVILVDDGLATGASMIAAVRAIRTQQPAAVVVAVPVASPDTCTLVRRDAEDCVCAMTPLQFYAVGAWYVDFDQTPDEEVRDLLAQAAQRSVHTAR